MDKEELKEYYRKYHKAHYRKMKEAGLCIHCGKPAVPGKTRCTVCAKWDSVKRQAFRDRMTEEEKEEARKKARDYFHEKMKDPAYRERYREQKKIYNKRHYEKWYKKGGGLDEIEDDEA